MPESSNHQQTSQLVSWSTHSYCFTSLSTGFTLIKRLTSSDIGVKGMVAPPRSCSARWTLCPPLWPRCAQRPGWSFESIQPAYGIWSNGINNLKWITVLIYAMKQKSHALVTHLYDDFMVYRYRYRYHVYPIVPCLPRSPGHNPFNLGPQPKWNKKQPWHGVVHEQQNFQNPYIPV